MRLINRGFTLVEVLAASGIVAATGAILAPTVIQNLEKQQEATCAANEDNIGKAMLQYVADNDFQYPMLQYYFGPNGQAFYPVDWTDALHPYLIARGDNGGTADSDTGGNVLYNGQGGVWNCPAFPTQNTLGEYGVNWTLCRDGAGTYEAQGYNRDYRLTTVNIASVQSPSDTVLLVEHGQAADYAPGESFNTVYFDPTESNWTNPLNVVNGVPTNPDTHNELQWDIDCAATDTTSTCGTGWGTSPGDMPRSRHFNHCNTLYVDGHVKAETRGEFTWYKHIYVPGLYEDLYYQVYDSAPTL